MIRDFLLWLLGGVRREFYDDAMQTALNAEAHSRRLCRKCGRSETEVMSDSQKRFAKAMRKANDELHTYKGAE